MSTQVSFSKLEKEFLSYYREKISTAEDIIDVEKYFSYTVKEFLNKALQKDGITFTQDDITLTYDTMLFSLKPLASNYQLKQLWKYSDIKDIVHRFADIAHKRILHLKKHPAKTEKIRR